MVLTELPLGLPGRVFRCPMPFSGYDRGGRVLPALRDHGVSVIVMLAEPNECLAHAGRDLAEVYRAEGFDLIHVPVPDLDAAARETLEPAVRRALECARAGRHVAIHCHAGKGRTGMFAACLARDALGLGGDEAIAWVRRHIPHAVETAARAALVRSWRG